MLQNLLIGRHRHRRTALWQELLFTPSVRRAELAQREAVEKVIDFLDLAKYRDSLVAGLPYGVRKVVELGRALATEPRLLLLDEPTSALDPISTVKIEELISELKEDYTITIVTHNMQQAARCSDYTAYMYLGELVEFGETDKIFLNPSKKETQDYITGRFG